MSRLDPPDPFAEKREQRDHTADLLHEQAYAYMAVHEPEKYAEDGVTLDEYSNPLYATAAALAYELDVGRLPVEKRLGLVLQLGRDTDRLTNAQSDELLYKLMDRPLGVFPDPKRMRRLSDLRKSLGHVQQGWEALRAGRPALGAYHCQNAAETASRAGNGRRRVTNGVEMVTRWIDELLDPKPELEITFGVPALSAAVGYASPGDVLVVGGATNAGKSTFALELILGTIERGDCVGHISTEDDERRTIRRVVSAYSGLSVLDLKARREIARATHAAQHFKDAVAPHYFFAEAKGYNELEICEDMTTFARRGARIIVVDYVQSIRSSNDRQDRRNEIASIMTALKTHAARVGVVLVIVSQLSRPRDGQPREPTMFALKEAGELENMSENVLLLWRDIEDGHAPMHVKLAKGKDGGAGTRWMMRRAAGSGRLVQCEAEVVPFQGPRRR